MSGRIAERATLPSDPVSLVQLGLRYEHAEGVPRDYARAIDLYCRAVELGNARAAYSLAVMRLNGRGAPQSDGKAVSWLRVAAAGQHEHSMRLLAVLRAPAEPDETLCASTSAGSGPTKPLRVPAYIAVRVNRLAPAYGLDEKLVTAIIAVESDFQASAVSPKNARGLMQLIPETSARFGVRDAFDPDQNLRGGMSYVRFLLGLFNGDVTLMLAAYNAGENAVLRHAGVPPYPETRQYVTKIRQYYARRHLPVGGNPPASGTSVPSN